MIINNAATSSSVLALHFAASSVSSLCPISLRLSGPLLLLGGRHGRAGRCFLLILILLTVSPLGLCCCWLSHLLEEEEEEGGGTEDGGGVGVCCCCGCCCVNSSRQLGIFCLGEVVIQSSTARLSCKKRSK